MATSNFQNENASRIYAVDLENDWDYDDLISNLEFELSNMPEYRDKGRDRHELRSYPSKVLGSLIDGDVQVVAIVRSGYYSGCNLDWDFYFNDEDFDSRAEDSAENKAKLDKLVKKLEDLYNGYSQTLKVKAIFSNGETWYEKA